MRRAAKTDANHAEVRDGLRAIGCSVEDLAGQGNGCPDLLVARNGWTGCFEVKIPGEKLNPKQKSWHAAWKGKAFVVWTLQEAIEIVMHHAGK